MAFSGRPALLTFDAQWLMRCGTALSTVMCNVARPEISTSLYVCTCTVESELRKCRESLTLATQVLRPDTQKSRVPEARESLGERGCHLTPAPVYFVSPPSTPLFLFTFPVFPLVAFFFPLASFSLRSPIPAYLTFSCTQACQARAEAPRAPSERGSEGLVDPCTLINNPGLFLPHFLHFQPTKYLCYALLP